MYNREELREQHAIGEEIGEAITQSVGNQGLDEEELEDELAELQQEELDKNLLKTGTVPVSDRLPQVATGESKFLLFTCPFSVFSGCSNLLANPFFSPVKGKAPVHAEEEDEEEELRKLQAEMAM